MQHNEEFIKGVTYGDVEDLMYSAQDEGFLTFLDEFKSLANFHAQEMLEGFIDDHFPENSKENEKRDEFIKMMTAITPSGVDGYCDSEDPIPGASKKLNKLIKKIRKHRE